MQARTRALRAPLRNATFRRFWAAEVLTEIGDWAARLALAVLVYAQSDSAMLAGLVTAVGLLAWVGPGQLLASLADRTSRRTVLVGCHLLRAACFAVAGVGVPLPALLVLVFLSGLAAPPAEAAAAAVRPGLVPAPDVPAVHTLTGIASDSALLLGSAVGGALITALGAAGALHFTAACFAWSAWLLRGLPAWTPTEPAPPRRLRRAARTLWGTPHIRRATALATVAMGSGTAASAMVAPYVLGELQRGAGTTAALNAAAAAVTIVLTLVAVPHLPDRDHQLQVVAVLSLGGGLLLCLFALTPGLPLLLAPLAGAGALAVVLVPASALVGPLLPDEIRASAFSLLMGLLAAAQALAVLAVGALADQLGTGTAVALAAVPSVAAGTWHLLVPVRCRGQVDGPPTPATAALSAPCAA